MHKLEPPLHLSSPKKLIIAIGLVITSHSAPAQNGVLEINQICAAQTGCFAGDVAGFPVTIDGTAGKSYRLTSDLSITTDVSGIEISSPFVSIDLSGFEIAGPGNCTGTAGTLDCGPVGTSDAIIALNTASHVNIRNGTVRNMSRDGIGIETVGRAENIVMRHNARHGIGSLDSVHVINSSAIENGDDGFDLDQGSIVGGCVARNNFQHGIEIDNAGGVVHGSISRGNGARGFNVASLSDFGTNNASSGNGAEDSCGGGICTPQRRFYLTQSTHDGANALGACDPGFHMASLWELIELSTLRYDVTRANALTFADSGQGPPPGSGWIRTGGIASSVLMSAGADNCSAWTSAAVGETGSRVGLWSNWENSVNDRTIDPWRSDIAGCSVSNNVWCVED